jgi:hypothetical protein
MRHETVMQTYKHVGAFNQDAPRMHNAGFRIESQQQVGKQIRVTWGRDVPANAPAPPPKKKGLPAIAIVGIVVGALILIGIIASAAGGGKSTATATPASPTQARATSGQPATAQVAATGASSATAPSAAVTSAPTRAATSPTTAAASAQSTAAGQQGITFGDPVSLSGDDSHSVAVLVTNTTDLVKSFTVKGTWKNGNTIAATASGAVNDLLPHSRRAATLLSSGPIPTTAESVRVDIDTMVSQSQTTPEAEIAKKQQFGTPSVKMLGTSLTVDIEVTNTDSAPHSYLVQVAYLKGDTLVAVTTGAVNDIAAGQTKTATLLGAGVTAGATAAPAITTVVQ